MAYDIGDKVRIKASFKNLAKELDDPTTVTIKIKKPDGTEIPYVYDVDAVYRTETGKYYYDLTFDASGRWYWRWVGTGDVHTADEGSIVVRETAYNTP